VSGVGRRGDGSAAISRGSGRGRVDEGTKLGNEPERADEPDLSTLLRGVVRDAETLIGLQFDLLRSEVREELHQARDAALSLASGAALIGIGGVLASFMAVHGLQRSTRMPLWACYGIVGGLLGAAGAGLVASGLGRAAGVRVVPAETAEALEENLAWIKDQATPRAT
jgi:hypothetical protein